MTGPQPRRILPRYSTTLPGALLLTATLLAGCTPDLFSDCPPAQLDPAGLPAPLLNPTVEERIAAVGHQPGEPFRFVAFGDQKHLLQDHFPPIRDRVTELAGTAPPLLLVIDTGDIVQDGRNGQEFECLREAIEPLAHLPYLLAVGNHELHKTDPEARRRVPHWSARRSTILC